MRMRNAYAGELPRVRLFNEACVKTGAMLSSNASKGRTISGSLELRDGCEGGKVLCIIQSMIG